MARPSEYDFDLCIEVCELIANGQNIINALESKWPLPYSTYDSRVVI